MYNDTTQFYQNLEKHVNATHKAASASFGALRQFVISAPVLVKELGLLADAESGPN